MLEIENLSIQIGNFRAENISLTVKDATIHVILGPSGSGKTVFIETIAGFKRPEKGRILFKDVDITPSPPELRMMAYVPQDLALFPHLTVRENIYFGLRARGITENVFYERADSIATSLYIKDHYERDVTTLSGGEKQRVALARALATGNKILLLDEPFSGLHEGLRKEFWFLLKKIQKTLNLTVIAITHDLEEAFFLGDFISIFINGKLHQSSSKEAARIPKDKIVASFYGLKNIFRGSWKGDNIFIPELKLTVPVCSSLILTKTEKNDFEVGIRSEDLIIYDPKRPDGISRVSPEVFSLPTLIGKITACFEKNQSVIMLFSPLNSEASLEIEIPYYKMERLRVEEKKNLALAVPPERLFFLYKNGET
uniref:ABC transporter ATP-binding protein n=1 Tax=candidate division WOR-3 bacterium TaxID=2052148 RepID=A0A7V3NU29_UNCW3